MKDFKIKITESYTYEIDIKAENRNQAFEKAKEYYENADDGYVGVANSNSFEGVRFKISNEN